MKPMLGPRGHVRHLGKVCFGMLITKSPLHRIEQGGWFASIIIFNTFYVLVPPPSPGVLALRSQKHGVTVHDSAFRPASFPKAFVRCTLIARVLLISGISTFPFTPLTGSLTATPRNKWLSTQS